KFLALQERFLRVNAGFSTIPWVARPSSSTAGPSDVFYRVRRQGTQRDASIDARSQFCNACREVQRLDSRSAASHAAVNSFSRDWGVVSAVGLRTHRRGAHLEVVIG